jgi:hypothetical protein
VAFGAGVIDGGIQATEAVDRPVDQLTHVLLAAHVSANDLGFRAESAQLTD